MTEASSSSPFAKIRHVRSRLADEVYTQLLDAIIAGHIQQGERLIQETLAEEIDVSRTPVREALLRLEQEGIVELSARRGFVVRQITESEIRDIYQAREAVEGFSARLVAEHGSPKVLEHLHEVLEKAAAMAQDSIQEAYEANELVHRAIVEATANVYLIKLFDVIWGRGLAMRLYADLVATADFVAEFESEHAILLDALSSGDGGHAATTMVEHIGSGVAMQISALSSR